jgi:hypothetical protein
VCLKLDDGLDSSVRGVTTDLPFPKRALFFSPPSVLSGEHKDCSTEVNRPRRDANYTFPEMKLGLEVLYIYGRSITRFYLYLIHMNYKDSRSGKGSHHASGCWSPASHRGGPVSFLNCAPDEVTSVRSAGTGFSSSNSVFPCQCHFTNVRYSSSS